MGQESRDWYRGKHPPNCTCVECSRLRQSSSTSTPKQQCQICPKCRQRSLWYNTRDRRYECLNVNCNAKPVIAMNTEKSPHITQSHGVHSPPNIKTPKPPRHKFSFSNGFKAFILVLILSVIGLITSTYAGNLIPFWLLFSFSILFSIEKWLSYSTRKHKNLGTLYRLILNLGILSFLGFVIWSGIMLFRQHFMNFPVTGSLVFLGECIFFFWLWGVVRKNSWRWPSMKLTITALVAAILVFSYAGVQPMANYKDSSISNLRSFFNELAIQPTTTINNSQTSNTPLISSPTPTNGELVYTTTTLSSITAIQPTPPQKTTTPTTTLAPQPGSRVGVDGISFAGIDQYAINTPDSAEVSINSLATYLAKGTNNDLEKTRAIYKWITQNISYNYSGFLSGQYGDTSANGVLARRTSICDGYSELFMALGKAMGLQVVKLVGWAKGISYTAGVSLTGPTNHAWNAVYLNDGWYLIDSTWGAGAISGGQFVREFKGYYFLTDPEEFILNHFPQNSQWQLLSTKVVTSSFDSFPRVYFMSSGSYLYSPLTQNLSAGTSQYFKIKIPGALDVAIVINGNWQYLPKNGNLFEGTILVGRGEISLCAKTSATSSMYDTLIIYNGQ